ncbi:PEP-CTERM protein-sorting domain-containing protein [Verrucomicrobium sp. GAS474]|uniref:beta strand repeat-containing protein n=1 Tax=Verrucomicrobium sp. GAS474 TaxID=1882831 RepID=UPI00087BC738|nr:PEP-CTERM sorting domain-containing protein [Verrucomicrobium sp. GAS474]SDT94330.1 PEP-CTERM protein-sorting domain-containing protein [Verrucomicrobium sp. GAS474]
MSISRPLRRTHLLSFATLALCLGSGLPAWSQWIGTANNTNYETTTNWQGGAINDTFGTAGWASTGATTQTLTFALGATTITASATALNNMAVGQTVGSGTSAFSTATTVASAFTTGTTSIALTSTTGMAVGQVITGTGIASGTTITAISGTTVTLSTATTGASNTGSYTALDVITAIDKVGGTFTVNGATTAAGTNASVAFNALNDSWKILITANRTLPGNFTYNSADPADVGFVPNSNLTWTFASATPTISVAMGGTGVSRGLTIGSGSRYFTMNFAGSGSNGDVTFAVDSGMSPLGNAASIDILSFSAGMTGIHNLTKTGGGTAIINPGTTAQVATVTGSVTINGGILRLLNTTSGVGVTDISSGTATPVSYSVYGRGSVLELSQTINSTNIIESTAPIALYGGALGTSSKYAQSLGVVTLGDGRNVIGNYTYNAPNTLTLASLVRQNDATVNLLGSAYTNMTLGGGNNILVANDANILASLSGGGASSGLATSIVPWASGTPVGSAWSSSGFQNTDLTAWVGQELVTYTTAGGFRTLTVGTGVGTASTGDYYNANTSALFNGLGTSTYNVNLTSSATVTADETINALRIGNSETVTIGFGSTLNITSGALFNAGNNSTTITGGTINTGNAALIVSGGGTGVNGLTIASTIANTITDQSKVGLIVAASGTTANTGGVTLSGTNTYGGYTLVQGNAVIASSGALNSAAALRIDNGGYATVAAGITAQVTALTGTGTLQFATASNANQLNLGGGTGANNTVTVNSGGLIGAGDPTGATQAGTLTLGSNVNNLTFNVGSTFAVDLSSATTFDQIVAAASGTNTLTLNGGTIRLTLGTGYTPTVGQTWLITNGFTLESGSLSNMLLYSTDGDIYSLSLAGLNNADLLVTLVAVPEPSLLWLLVLGGGVLLAARRRAAVRTA